MQDFTSRYDADSRVERQSWGSFVDDTSDRHMASKHANEHRFTSVEVIWNSNQERETERRGRANKAWESTTRKWEDARGRRPPEKRVKVKTTPKRSWGGFGDALTAWPAADIFTDDAIGRWAVPTCSELGSERIRLIKVKPGLQGTLVECEMKVCSIHNAGEYTAVSYAWGRLVARHPIIVDQQPHLVTNNQWHFLRHAKHAGKHLSGWLWLDTLSIDQMNPQEKLVQVGILNTVFERAKRVVVWLGPAYENSDLAMEVLSSHSSKSPRKILPKLFVGQGWSAIHCLCERSYWRRLWVFQELKASKHAILMCGSEIVRIKRLMAFLFDLEAQRLEDKIGILRKSSAGRMLTLIKATLDTSLWSLLKTTSHLQCSDAHDKVYAIINVASSGHETIVADYAISLPTLMNTILRNLHLASPPKSLKQVASQCKLLEQYFGVECNSIFSVAPSRATPRLQRYEDPLTEFATAHYWDFKLEMLLSQWCEYYGHARISRLLTPTRDSKLKKHYAELPKPGRERRQKSDYRCMSYGRRAWNRAFTPSTMSHRGGSRSDTRLLDVIR